ncbi:MAG: 50S ribosomal protein L14 [Planctomycetota bacterium]|nr:50S ribosomal protein L14 [Planctomycetota bacterium]
MIQMQTRLDVADNSGAKSVMCIQVLGSGNKKVAAIGDIIVGSVKKAQPGSDIKQGDVVKGVIVRSKYGVRRADGIKVRFDGNAIVIVDNDGNLRGTRIFGAVARELRQKKFTRILSLATEVV